MATLNINITSSEEFPKKKIDKMSLFVEENLSLVSPLNCIFNVGDEVTFRNQYGVEFHNNKIIGFTEADEDSRFIYLDNSSYWFPVGVYALVHEGETFKESSPHTQDLELKNGQRATYTHTDYWNRPNYLLESGSKACCTNLNGTHLHTMSQEGEPDFPLKDEYQPAT